MSTQSLPIFSGATATGESGVFSDFTSPHRTYQATVSGTGSVSATIVFYVSNDKTNWITIGTITLSGTTSSTDGFTSEAPWKHTKAAITSISGTGAAVSAYIGA